MTKSFVLAACLLTLLAGPAAAQKLTPEQIETVRANCKADFTRLCPGVPPGGRALLCLREHMASLSPACAKAVNAAK
jgi:hypothetical protein